MRKVLVAMAVRSPFVSGAVAQVVVATGANVEVADLHVVLGG